MDGVIALDVGGTTLKGAVLDRDGTALATLRETTPRADGPDAVVAAVLDAATALAAQARKVTGRDPAAAGVGVLGTVDEVEGIARYSGNAGWRDVPLRALLQERLGIPVWFGHDVRAGAIAEGALGAGRDAADFLFVALGTGIGGAIVRDGHALLGAGGLAGEIGHIVVVPDGRLCPCGGHGCAEAYASGPAIVAAYGDPALGAGDVVARAAAGDARARAVWTEVVGALATAVAAAVALLDPALVVLGGGLALAGAQLRDPLAHAVQARLAFREAPPLTLAQLDDRAAYLGAGIAAWELVS